MFKAAIRILGSVCEHLVFWEQQRLLWCAWHRIWDSWCTQLRGYRKKCLTTLWKSSATGALKSSTAVSKCVLIGSQEGTVWISLCCSDWLSASLVVVIVGEGDMPVFFQPRTKYTVYISRFAHNRQRAKKDSNWPSLAFRVWCDVFKCFAFLTIWSSLENN